MTGWSCWRLACNAVCTASACLLHRASVNLSKRTWPNMEACTRYRLHRFLFHRQVSTTVAQPLGQHAVCTVSRVLCCIALGVSFRCATAKSRFCHFDSYRSSLEKNSAELNDPYTSFRGSIASADFLWTMTFEEISSHNCIYMAVSLCLHFSSSSLSGCSQDGIETKTFQ
eukprot:g58589.t1